MGLRRAMGVVAGLWRHPLRKRLVATKQDASLPEG